MSSRKFIPISKLLSQRILIVTLFTTIVVTVCVVVFVTKGVMKTTDFYFHSQVKASNDFLSKDINDIGYFNMRAYCLVIDSLGHYIYHPDRQRIGKGNFFQDSPQTSMKELAADLSSDSISQGIITLDGNTYYAYFGKRANTGWVNVIVVPVKSMLISTSIAGLIILAIIVCGLLLTYWISRFTISRTTKPLQLLAKSADEVAKGNFENPLPELIHNNEVSQLRDSFANMQQSLTSYIDRLKTATAEKAVFQYELKIAHDIQMSMVPTVFPERDDVSIHAFMTPARPVGGDFYDFFFSGDKLYFCIGDVSGKGIPAALVMTEAKRLFGAYAKEEDLPDRIVSKMNFDLSENNLRCMFATLFVGILDLTSGLLQYSNAGHLPPIVIRKQETGDGSLEVTTIPVNNQFPVGSFPDASYETQETVIVPPSTILVYTDGLNEAKDAADQAFGNDRVISEVNQAAQAGVLSPKALIERMTQVIHDFVDDAEQSDDLTILGIQYKKNCT